MVDEDLASAPVSGSRVVVFSIVVTLPSALTFVTVDFETTGFRAVGVPDGTHLTEPLEEVMTPSDASQGGAFLTTLGGVPASGIVD